MQPRPPSLSLFCRGKKSRLDFTPFATTAVFLPLLLRTHNAVLMQKGGGEREGKRRRIQETFSALPRKEEEEEKEQR